MNRNVTNLRDQAYASGVPGCECVCGFDNQWTPIPHSRLPAGTLMSHLTDLSSPLTWRPSRANLVCDVVLVLCLVSCELAVLLIGARGLSTQEGYAEGDARI